MSPQWLHYARRGRTVLIAAVILALIAYLVTEHLLVALLVCGGVVLLGLLLLIINWRQGDFSGLPGAPPPSELAEPTGAPPPSESTEPKRASRPDRDRPAMTALDESPRLEPQPAVAPPPPASPSQPIAEEKAAAAEPPADPVHFSAYYPPKATPKPHSLVVYAHVAAAIAAVGQDVERLRARLGGVIEPPKTASETTRLQRGTLITVVPESEEITFAPFAVTQKWEGDWTRFEFEFTPKAELISQTIFTRISIQVATVEIAHIKVAMDIVAESPATAAPPENPLMAAKLQSATTPMYNKIFVSYSRKDRAVAWTYRQAQLAAGNEVFIDTESIHAGEDWQAALAKAIDSADIFQLFWSERSAASPNVRDEWDYALKYKCPDDLCRGFIRPVYWENPLPTPPAELAHLNFRFVELIAPPDV